MTTFAGLFDFEAVFLHTDNLKQAIHQYSGLLQYPVIPGLYDGPIYVMELYGGAKLLLDDYRLDTHHYDPKPTFVFRSDDLEKAFHEVQRGGWHIVLPIAKGTGMNFFLFRDEDHHVFAVCDRSIPYPAVRDSQGERKCHLTHLYIPVRHVDRAGNRYSGLLGTAPLLQAEPKSVCRCSPGFFSPSFPDLIDRTGL